MSEDETPEPTEAASEAPVASVKAAPERASSESEERQGRAVAKLAAVGRVGGIKVRDILPPGMASMLKMVQEQDQLIKLARGDMFPHLKLAAMGLDHSKFGHLARGIDFGHSSMIADLSKSKLAALGMTGRAGLFASDHAALKLAAIGQRSAVGHFYDQFDGTRDALDAVRKIGAMGSLSPLMSGILWGRADRTDLFAGELRKTLDAVGGLSRLTGFGTGFADLLPMRRAFERDDLAGLDFVGELASRAARSARWREDTITRISRTKGAWVDDGDPAGSLEAFAEYRALTDVVVTEPPGSRRTTQALRAKLGDFRAVAPIADEVADDPLLRTGLRLELGFDGEVASLPAALLGQLFAPFGFVSGPIADADPEALEQVLSLMLKKLERAVRRFIVERMEARFGTAWIKQRVPQATREAWAGRRQHDVDNGRRPGAPIDYADFEDYRRIIDRGDNWSELFASIFVVKTAINETLRRLSLVRNPIAHYRPVTSDDLFILRVEGVAMFRWMGIGAP